MTIKLSISIQAHPKRKIWAEELSQKLNCPIAWDSKQSTWDTRKKALNLIDPNSDYCCVIQDDSILCENFIEKATDFIERIEVDYPTDAIQFYHGHESGSGELSPNDFERGYARRPALVWGVAICLHTEWIKDIIKYGNASSIQQDDTKIRNWLLSKGYKTIYPLPCLVDHRRVKENPTLVPSYNSDRFSPYFIDLK